MIILRQKLKKQKKGGPIFSFSFTFNYSQQLIQSGATYKN
jgi:hypothetical protein